MIVLHEEKMLGEVEEAKRIKAKVAHLGGGDAFPRPMKGLEFQVQ